MCSFIVQNSEAMHQQKPGLDRHHSSGSNTAQSTAFVHQEMDR